MKVFPCRPVFGARYTATVVVLPPGSVMDLVPYAVPFFLGAIILEFVWGRWSGSDTYRLNDTVNSLSLGVLSTATKL